MNRFRGVILSTALSFLFVSVMSADDLRGKESASRENKRLDESDPKGGPVVHVRARDSAASRWEPRFPYRDWQLEKAKLPWEPNAPGG
jgi:hypothetical protein